MTAAALGGALAPMAMATAPSGASAPMSGLSSGIEPAGFDAFFRSPQMAISRAFHEGSKPESGPGWMLRAAALAGDLPALRAQLDMGSDPFAPDAAGNCALMAAAYGGHAGCVALLARLGARGSQERAGKAMGILLEFAAAGRRRECFAALSPWAEPDGGKFLELAVSGRDARLAAELVDWHWRPAFEGAGSREREARAARGACSAVSGLMGSMAEPSSVREARRLVGERSLSLSERWDLMEASREAQGDAEAARRL